MKILFSIVRSLLSRARITFLKCNNPHAQVVVTGGLNISKDADIEVSNGSKLTLGRGLHVRKNTILAARDNAILAFGEGCFVNRNSIIIARRSIVIGNGVTIGPNVCIYDHDHDMRVHGSFFLASIEIKDNVWIGANATILKGVTIGEGAVVASGCIVTHDVPPHTILIQKRNSIYKDIQ